ncbi:MAG: FGGY family carbohydrate kinase [Bacteroidota bacterium]
MPTNYLLGYDIGSSSIKASLVRADSGKVVASATSPSQELPMEAPREGWAEQHPDLWWDHLVKATHQLQQTSKQALQQVAAIGISYQMHGLVVVDKDQQVLRPSIIWCDSRAVRIGEQAFQRLGQDWCLSRLLNSPGNFTASKLRWVQENESQVYEKIYKIMLPGDYVAMKLTGEITTTVSGLSEGIFWDFKAGALSQELLEYYQIDQSLIPEQVPTFGEQGRVQSAIAEELGVPANIPVAYRAGDQPNNALSLNVLKPGEVATTAGTSGVIYGVSDQLEYDPQSRVNSFAHVNHRQDSPRYGILACVNGTGILNSWLKRQLLLDRLSYDAMNQLAQQAPIGAAGVVVLPFGNGAERPLANAKIGSHISGVEFNTHTTAHIVRAAQEGIVFALKYSLDIMSEMGVQVNCVKAGKANMFLSPLFREAFANTTGATIELYDTDGSAGAARGAGIGAGEYSNPEEAFAHLQKIDQIEPESDNKSAYDEAYNRWLGELEKHL